MPNKKTGNYIFIIIIIAFVFLLAFLIPSLYDAQEGPKTKIYTQEGLETYVITKDLEATVNVIKQSPSTQVNITMTDIASGESDTVILSEGDSETVSFSKGDITVTNLNKISNSLVTIQYDYPMFHGWPAGSQTVVQSLTMLIVMLLFLLIIGGIWIQFGDDNK